MNLRPYQTNAKEAVLAEWEAGNKKTLIVCATGCGKTIIFSSIAKEQVAKGHRVLILAHRSELLSQAADKLLAATGLESVLEKAESSCLGSDIPVVIGSIQSLAQERRLAQFAEDYFQDIIIDEAHHCLSDTYQRVLAHFPNANILGVTATPDRGDMKNLGTYFDSLAFEYSMRDAISDGYLCPVMAQMIPLQIDIADVGISNGDFNVGEVGSALEPYLWQIAREMTHYCRGKKTVVFLPLIKMSQEFCTILNEVGFNATEIHGTSKDRTEILEAFSAGEYDVLCNSMLLTEGWDCPAVDCIICLRPTRSRALYQQIIGRGTRLHEGKENLLILDFLWMTARHDLCRPSSLLSENAEVANRMNEALIKGTNPFNLLEMEAQAKQDITEEREKALAKQLAAMRMKRQKLVDPLQFFVSIGDARLTNYEPTFKWETQSPTQKQLDFLEKSGINPDTVKSKGDATQLISRLMKRKKGGFTTPKQIRLLERYGFKHVGLWKASEASEIIDMIANNKWRLPRGIDPEQYKPESKIA